jgi:hypothetical protein
MNLVIGPHPGVHRGSCAGIGQNSDPARHVTVTAAPD